MLELLNLLLDSPIPGTLVLGGLVWIGFAIAGHITKEIAISKKRQWVFGIFGFVLIVCGIAMDVVPQTKPEIATKPVQVTRVVKITQLVKATTRRAGKHVAWRHDVDYRSPRPGID